MARCPTVQISLAATLLSPCADKGHLLFTGIKGGGVGDDPFAPRAFVVSGIHGIVELFLCIDLGNHGSWVGAWLTYHWGGQDRGGPAILK